MKNQKKKKIKATLNGGLDFKKVKKTLSLSRFIVSLSSI